MFSEVGVGADGGDGATIPVRGGRSHAHKLQNMRTNGALRMAGNDQLNSTLKFPAH
jgi:hypothetical protein